MYSYYLISKLCSLLQAICEACPMPKAAVNLTVTVKFPELVDGCCRHQTYSEQFDVHKEVILGLCRTSESKHRRFFEESKLQTYNSRTITRLDI